MSACIGRSKGRVSSTTARATGMTGLVSRASVRPRLSGATAWSACRMLDGTTRLQRTTDHARMRLHL